MSDRPGSQPAETMAQRRESSLLRWVWRSYVRNALIPLLVVELLLVAVYLTSHAWSASRNVAALREVARAELSRIADDESEIIDNIHGGRIEITSKPLQGTSVTLWLPRAAARG
jgi:cell division protein FtsL